MHRPEPGSSIEGFGQIALVLAVAGALLLLVAALFTAWLRIIVPISGSYWDTDHEGVELLLFPLAVAGAAVARARLGVLVDLPASRVGPALPLLAAGDALHAERASIEADRPGPGGAEWSWLRHDAFTFSSINLRRDGAIHDASERLAETREWMLDTLPRLRAVLERRVAGVLEGLPAPEGT